MTFQTGLTQKTLQAPFLSLRRFSKANSDGSFNENMAKADMTASVHRVET